MPSTSGPTWNAREIFGNGFTMRATPRAACEKISSLSVGFGLALLSKTSRQTYTVTFQRLDLFRRASCSAVRFLVVGAIAGSDNMVVRSKK